jgi:hypothetical protein
MQNLIRVGPAVRALVLVAVAGYAGDVTESSQLQTSGVSSPQDNEELRRMYDEDQGDRSARDPRTVDWTVVAPRDRVRRDGVKALFAEGRFVTANDYYHAAMILQHGEVPEDFLLAHELAVAAIIKGNGAAAWLAAATEDRFLTNIGRLQRFGTQFKADGGGPWRLEPVDPTITDELRKVMGTASLEEARARVADLNRAR